MRKVCRQCGTKYEADATYCNECDIDLDEENTTINTDVDAETKRGIKRACDVTRNIHLTIAGVIYLAIFLLNLRANINDYNIRDSEAFFLYFGAVIGFIHGLAAYGVSSGKKWGRKLSIIIGFYLLIGFPVGTIIGFIILKQMFKKEWLQIN